MSDTKFVGICIVAAAALLAGVLRPREKTETGRYQFQVSTPPGVIWRMDTVTGEIKTNP